MKKIGILGGSFNPPHKAHLHLAEAAISQFGLDFVLVIPNHHPPHKTDEEFVSDEHRMRMVKKLISKNDRLKFSDIELKRDDISYTYKTLEELKKEYPKDQLYFIMGADSLEYFSEWRCPEIIAKLAVILVAPRGDTDKERLDDLIALTKKEVKGKYYPLFVPEEFADVSSSGVRTEMTYAPTDITIDDDKKASAYDLTKKVYRYIRIHGLYGCTEKVYKDITDKQLKKALKCTLDDKRYKHTLGVSDTAKKLAKTYAPEDDIFQNKAYMTGLLHDCAKYYTHEEQLSLCEKYGVRLTVTEIENPALIHGKLGAYLAKHRYGIDDEEILEAIRVHTVGKPAMSLLDRIVYVSDYIEPSRKINGAVHKLDDIRKIAFLNIDMAVYQILENTVSYLSDSYKKIDEMSFKTMEYYKEYKGELK